MIVILFFIVLGCILDFGIGYLYGFRIGLYKIKYTTVEDFYPHEKHEKNAYILLLNYLYF